MNSPESPSPFNDLDVFCEWTGDPNDTVEVKVTVQVWCKPGAQIPVLNVRSPSVVGIRSYTLRPLSPPREPGCAHVRSESPVRDSDSDTPVTPIKQSVHDSHTDSAGLKSSTNDTPPSFLSDDESVVVRARTDEDITHHNPFYAEWSLEATSPETSPSSQIPRKRTAKAASLPDSVSDSERPYGGCKHRVGPSDAESPQDASPSKILDKPSLIPRRISPTKQHRPVPENASLPRISTSELETRSTVTGQESMSPDQPDGEKIVIDRVVPVIPYKCNSGHIEESSGDNHEQDVERLSTVVSRGSPCDLTDGCCSLESESLKDTGDGPLYSSPYPKGIRMNGENPTMPQLVLVDGAFTIHCQAGTRPAAYKASIEISVKLQRGHPKGWWELVVPGLPPLQKDDFGYVYISTPAGQGVEFRTTYLLKYTLMESCLMGQFSMLPKLVIPIRPCDGKFYGFLKDFKVTHTIRTEVVEDQDPLFYVIRYYAVCSLDLIHRDLWSEKCGFYIYVYGGPKGEFTCHLQEPERAFHTIHLNAALGTDIGVSELEVICSPSNLAMFTLTWEVKLPRGHAITWVPYIRSNKETSAFESELQSGYEQTEKENSQVVVLAIPRAMTIHTLPTPCRKAKRSLVRFSVGLLCLAVIFLVLAYWLFVQTYSSRELIELGLPAAPNRSVDVEDAIIAGSEEQEEVHEALDIASMIEENVEPATSLPTSFPTSVPLRDRVDYLLGWRGPIARV